MKMKVFIQSLIDLNPSDDTEVVVVVKGGEQGQMVLDITPNIFVHRWTDEYGRELVVTYAIESIITDI